MIINEKYFKQYSPIPLNYNMAEIKNYIGVAQEIWLSPLIGDDLLDELEEQVKDNNVSPTNAALLTDGKLWQYLAFATCLEGLPFIWSHFSETGISLGKSDNSDSITLKDLTYIEQHLRRQTEFLKDSVKKYICERPSAFPLVCQCECECGSCCGSKAKLRHPNPYLQLYSTRRKCTDLK
ncbi:MAG: hypothetical protein J6S67_06185 [Methanobrevibacter sp.]|nr:hypothetical protein [Methanobrevibacter sp.]